MMHNPFHESPADIITITPADPAVGAQLSFGAAVNTRIRPVHVYFRFTASGVAGNRVVRIGINDGLNTHIIGLSSVLVTAAAVRDFFFNVGVGTDKELLGGAGSNEEWCSMNNEAILRFGDSLVTSINNIDAGDQISGVVIRYKQWIMPA